MSKITKDLYEASDALAKTASKIRDIEVFLTFNPSKIFKRFIRKSIYRKSWKITNKISRKIK